MTYMERVQKEENLRVRAREISRKVNREYGDHGSCVMGYVLKLDGKKFIPQPAQGSCTCDLVYEKVKEMLIAEGICTSRISTDYGRMD
jgi:hypothetical protein